MRRGWVVALAVLVVCGGLVAWHGWRARRVARPLPAVAMQGEPRLMLWAWEVPEDLRALDPARAGVAFLAREVFVGRSAVVRPRRQPLRVAEGTWLMATVRLEAMPGFADSDALREQTVEAILPVLAEPNVRGLQVDFDAAASQRDFYAAVLRGVRARMLAGMPLSMTALVSWCGTGSWLGGLATGAVPVDEAVPMFFRMGGPATLRARAARSFAGVRERKCLSAAGIATDEAWPAIAAEQRVYVFKAGAWTEKELASVNALGYEGLRETAAAASSGP